MLAPFADGTPPLRRRLAARASGRAAPADVQASTRRTDPGEPELHCDFIFVSDDLAPRVRAVRVDRETQASDHQPVILTLG